MPCTSHDEKNKKVDRFISISVLVFCLFIGAGIIAIVGYGISLGIKNGARETKMAREQAVSFVKAGVWKTMRVNEPIDAQHYGTLVVQPLGNKDPASRRSLPIVDTHPDASIFSVLCSGDLLRISWQEPGKLNSKQTVSYLRFAIISTKTP